MLDNYGLINVVEVLSIMFVFLSLKAFATFEEEVVVEYEEKV